MRDYGRVYSAFWQSGEARSFSEDGRMLALYLLTSPHANLIGCYRLPDAYVAEDMQWSSQRVAEGFAQLQSKGFVSRDEGTKWVFIHKYLMWNAFENGNVAIAAQKAFDQVPAIPLKAALAVALLEFGKHLKEDFANHLQTLPKPFANPEPEPEPILNQNQNQSLNPAGTLFGAPPPEDAPRKAKPVPKKLKAPSSTAETWAAYSGAYESRYGVRPVRNASVNAKLAQFVERIGAEESPSIAAWFLTHKNSFYVSSGHSIGAMLHDAEKLRTEWATGRQGTQTQAMLGDRTQTNANAFAGLLAEAQQKDTHAKH